MKNLPVVFFILFFLSCKSEEEAMKEFYQCLSIEQRSAVNEMRFACDKFIKMNYPNVPLDQAYIKFLKDIEQENENWKINDQITLMSLNRKLKDAFGDDYNDNNGDFYPLSALMTCLQKTSKNRHETYLINSIMAAGGPSPHIIAWYIIINKLNPNQGQLKLIFQTQVVYQLIFLDKNRKDVVDDD